MPAHQLDLTLMGEGDADFVLGIRNEASTRSMLHNSRMFTPAEFRGWLTGENPEWLIVSDRESGDSVGYVRTKWLDDDKTDLQVGVDIHPGFRRQGYARSAFEALFRRLEQKMVGAVSLEVLDHNPVARHLYDDLGFEPISSHAFDNRFGSTTSTVMRKELVPLTGRQCKVIACWFGPRRAWAGLHGPEESFAMYMFLLEQELRIDKGLPCDAVLVVNMPTPGELTADPWFQRTLQMVRESNGKATPNGRIRVLERPNIGLSFGAFDHAFHELREEYDFWHFLEDDHIVIRDGLLRSDYDTFKQLGDDIGFVASVGCSDVFGRHCHGGCGLSSRTVLAEGASRYYSEALGRHHLPFWYNKQEGAENHNLHGEVPFTNVIAASGLKLVDSKHDKFLVNWRAQELRNCHGEAIRFVEWSEEMCRVHAANP